MQFGGGVRHARELFPGLLDWLVGLRLHEPGSFATFGVGRAYLIRYKTPTNLEIEQRIWPDFVAHRDALGGRTVNIMLVEHPVPPLAPVDVRDFWRRSMATDHKMEALALVSGGFLGLWAAAVTHLFEHLVPERDLHFRVFRDLEAAITWIFGVDLHASEAELRQAITQLQALR